MKLLPILLEIIKGSFKNSPHHRIGRCNICGMPTLFICIDKMKMRENMFCLFCQSSSRKRHIAKMIIGAVFKNKIRFIKEIPKSSNIKIYNTDISDSFYKALKKYKYFTCSELIKDVRPGTRVRERVYCQDLEKLTFEDEIFDLVITEDVFEHVRNYKGGFKEIYRVLKPGGYHVFTVPCNFAEKTVVRVDVRGDADIYVLPPEYHGGPRRGKILAYRTFGYDISEILKIVGFDTKIDFSKTADRKFGIFASYTFVSRKPEKNTPPT